MSLSVLLVSLFTFVQFNCENLFDCQHDSLKNDIEFLPDGSYHWTPFRYWRKLNRVGQTIVSCGDRVGGAGTQAAEDFSVTEESVASWRLPDMVALCEVENDSVMRDLTKRSLLRTARYEYVVTDSPDARGIDVALMYSPFSFRLLNSRAVRITPVRDMSPTRDLLYASGVVMSGDTLHVIVAHLPSRRGGEQLSRPFRRVVAEKIRAVADSVRAVAAAAKIIVAGDFNDYAKSESVRLVCADGFTDVSAEAVGQNGARATYKHHGEWRPYPRQHESVAVCALMPCSRRKVSAHRRSEVWRCAATPQLSRSALARRFQRPSASCRRVRIRRVKVPAIVQSFCSSAFFTLPAFRISAFASS